MKPIRLSTWQFNTLRISTHLMPIVWLGYVFYLALSGAILGDPVQYLIDFTGLGAFNMLLISLLVSPLAQYLRFSQLMLLRRPIGVYSALYAMSHLGVFIAFELQFEMKLVMSEIIDRPYITVGFAALIILSLLTLTSLNSLKRILGKNWQKLHNWVYLAILLVILHYVWSLKTLDLEAWCYILLFVLVMGLRTKKLLKYLK